MRAQKGGSVLACDLGCNGGKCCDRLNCGWYDLK